MSNETPPRPQLSRRTFLKAAAGFVAGGLGLGTVAGCKPGESPTPTTARTSEVPTTPIITPTSESTSSIDSTTSTIVSETTTTVEKPDYEVLPDGSLLFKGEKIGLPEWFGGVQLGLRDVEGKVIGTFSDSKRGPIDFYTALLTVIQKQGDGKYGQTVEEVGSYLQAHDGMVQLSLVEPSDEVGNYKRIPPDVQKSEEFALDLKKPVAVEFVTSTPEGANMIVLNIGGLDYWIGFGINNGQLTLYDRMYKPHQEFAADSKYDFLSFGYDMCFLLETLSRATTITRDNYKDFFEDIGVRMGENQFNEQTGSTNIRVGDFIQLSGSRTNAGPVKIENQMFDYLS